MENAYKNNEIGFYIIFSTIQQGYISDINKCMILIDIYLIKKFMFKYRRTLSGNIT